MKQNKRFTALLLAIAMTLSFAGCLVPAEKDTADATAVPNDTNAPVDSTNFDSEAVAVELGDIKITAGEIEESFTYYANMLQSYYGVSITDDESIQEYREMAITDLIHYYVPQWKANELGIALSAEEEADIEKVIGEQIDSLRTNILCEYAYQYGGAAELYDDVAKLSEEELNAAMEEINAELAEYYRPGFSLEDYLAEQQKSMVNDERITRLTEELREASQNEFTVTDEQIAEWYENALEEQKASYDEEPSLFREAEEQLKDNPKAVPNLYVPEGLVRVQMIVIAPKEERDLKIETNRSEMAALEAEYGKLALNGEDPERQAEILARYTELKTENDTLEEEFMGETRTKINEAYEALEEETPFEDVMKQYNDDGAQIETVLCPGDEVYGELYEYAAELLVGTYSEPIQVDGTYYIVKSIEKPEAGVVDRALIEDALRLAAIDDLTDAQWEELYQSWQTEAETAAIRHEDAYAAIGYLN
jgi:hypothetical protein